MNSRFATTQEINLAASGRWIEILETLCPALDDSIKSLGRHVTCPIHGGKGDFRLCSKNGPEIGLSYCTCGTRNGYQLLQELNGWTFLESKDAVADFVGLAPSTSYQDKKEREEKLKAAEKAAEARRLEREKLDAYLDEKKRERLNALWTESIPLDAPAAEPARIYLASRKMDWRMVSSKVRFHPSALLPQEEGIESMATPAMVSRVYDNDGLPLTLHVTHLTHQGVKLSHHAAKHLLPTLSTSKPSNGLFVPAMNLNGSEVLGIAEGLETALCASLLHNIPVWPAISSGPLRNFIPPQSIKHLVCFADLDANGTGAEAALKLGENLAKAGWNGQYSIAMPPEHLLGDRNSIDWADVWYEYYQPQAFQDAM